eukprot:2863194-Amphidinium_carterae.1
MVSLAWVAFRFAGTKWGVMLRAVPGHGQRKIQGFQVIDAMWSGSSHLQNCCLCIHQLAEALLVDRIAPKAAFKGAYGLKVLWVEETLGSEVTIITGALGAHCLKVVAANDSNGKVAQNAYSARRNYYLIYSKNKF